MIIKTRTGYINTLKTLAKQRPKYFYLATFGFKLDDDFKEVMQSLPKNCDVRILIGVHKPTPRQLKFYKTMLPSAAVKVVKEFHVKLLVTDQAVLTGSRNYTGGEWDELGIKLKTPYAVKKFTKYFLEMYDRKTNLL